jgi:ATP-dependent Zn protease
MAWLMDQEIRRLIMDAESRAEDILKSKRKTLENLAEALLKEETLDRDAIEQIIRSSRKEET